MLSLVILDKYSDIGRFITNTFLQNLMQFFFGISKKSLSLIQITEWLKKGCITFTLKYPSSKRMLIVEHTGNKERNIVFQKWRGTHYRKWTWSVGFQRKKYCSKCANIHFHPGENPFRESSQLIKSCASC